METYAAQQYNRLVARFGDEHKLENFGVLRAAAHNGMIDLYLDQLPNRTSELVSDNGTAIDNAPFWELIKSKEITTSNKLELIKKTIEVEPKVIEQEDESQKSPLRAICLYFSMSEKKQEALEIIKVLIAAKAEINTYPAAYSILCGPYETIASIHTPDSDKSIARDVVKVLKDAGAKLNLANPGDAKYDYLDKSVCVEPASMTPSAKASSPTWKQKFFS